MIGATNSLKSNSSSSFSSQLISLIKSCSYKPHLLQIHAQLLRSYLLQVPAISFPFLSRAALSPFEDISYSRRIFSQIPNPSPFHYNSMIRAYSFSDSPIQGFHMFQQMRLRGLPSDPVSLSSLTKCFIKLCSLIGGLQIHARVLRDGHRLDCLLLTNLMDLYSLCQRGNDACKVFDEMPERDTVAWNVLISCLIRNHRTRDVLGVFDGMISGDFGCKPDDVTCLLLVQACSNLGAIEFGEKVHNFIQESGYIGKMSLCNSLIAMYSKCGSLEKAYNVFKSTPSKNVVSWSAMISGFAMNGFGREAIEAFHEMQSNGIPPDDQTFTGVLSACSHCGLIDEGMSLFDKLTQQFGITPNIHHYGCMVDLLGRAGNLDQAYELIMSMNVQPDSTIWRTLLGACRIHRNFTLGERIISHLIEIKAQEAGDYVLLLNIYSSIGDWRKVTELRKFMQENGIQTIPGCSSIEWKGEIHEFIADDVSHPLKDDIFRKLGEINEQIRIAGYVVEIKSELHNLGEEEKRDVLSYHSEKLAIAFGVLVMPPGETIRIAKNIRTCVDCHNFAKIVSAVYNRKVVIRDRTRFHHFFEGRCSCNEYW